MPPGGKRSQPGLKKISRRVSLSGDVSRCVTWPGAFMPYVSRYYLDTSRDRPRSYCATYTHLDTCRINYLDTSSLNSPRRQLNGHVAPIRDTSSCEILSRITGTVGSECDFSRRIVGTRLYSLPKIENNTKMARKKLTRLIVYKMKRADRSKTPCDQLTCHIPWNRAHRNLAFNLSQKFEGVSQKF